VFLDVGLTLGEFSIGEGRCFVGCFGIETVLLQPGNDLVGRVAIAAMDTGFEVSFEAGCRKANAPDGTSARTVMRLCPMAKGGRQKAALPALAAPFT
jgi:hypothetical protein